MANNEQIQQLPAQSQQRLPTLEELHHDLELAGKNDALNQLLSTPPPQKWIKNHPYVNVKVITEGKEKSVPLQYLPVERVKFLLTRIFQRWEWQIKTASQLFNSVTVIGTLKVLDPITGEWIQNDGIGAVGVQTDAGKSASDMASIKTDAVMKAAPAAESYALKNAAEKFGLIFGGNLMKDVAPFTPTYAQPVSYEELSELYELKKDVLNEEDRSNAERILNNREVKSYSKLQRQLQGL